MIPPGIDLVYLPDALSRPRSRHARFREIVFHPEELPFIDQAEDPEKMVHILWAAKEAVYKSWRQQHAIPARFVPHQVTIRSLSREQDQYRLTAAVQNTIHPVLVNCTDEWVMALAGTATQVEVIRLAYDDKNEARLRLSQLREDWTKDHSGLSFFTYSHDGPLAAVAAFLATPVSKDMKISG